MHLGNGRNLTIGNGYGASFGSRPSHKNCIGAGRSVVEWQNAPIQNGQVKFLQYPSETVFASSIGHGCDAS